MIKNVPSCENCEGTGIIKGTFGFQGALPDLECSECLGSGKDYKTWRKNKEKKDE